MKFTCEQVARAGLGEPGKREGTELLYPCPHPERHQHGDAHPSLKINPKKDTWGCFVCGVGGTAWQLAAFIAGVDPGDNAAVKAWLKERGLLNGPTSGGKHITATYDFTDEAGRLLYQEVRYEPKDFKFRRPNGKGGWVWHLECNEDCKCEPKLPPVRRVLYNLPTLLKATSVLVLEGPKDCESAQKLGLVATTNAMGAKAPWLPGYSETLRGKRLCLAADADAPGVAHTKDAARSLIGMVQSVKLIEALPGVPNKGDLTDYVQAGGTRESLPKLIEEAPHLTAADVAKWKAEPATAGPWAGIESMESFLSGDDDDAEFLHKGNRFLARQCITEVFSPRGLGKTLFALWLAVLLAMRGLRVLYIDRDNPKRVTKARLRRFGAKAEMKNLNAITREKCPPLTDSKGWTSFPYSDYDVVILDSFDSAAEGVGEQDSAKPSKAIAPLVDIARRENGPSVLVLGNTTKDAKHSRGSGVIEDRADIVYEVRDASKLQASGQKAWWEELPPADAGSWAGRASWRKQQEKSRLAFISSKFRIGPEPEPFILEIDTTTDPWTVKDVTDQVDAEGAAAREQRAREKAEAIEKAPAALVAEVIRRNQAREPALLKKQAEEFLTHLAGLRITQKEAREITESKTFELVPVAGKGHSKAVQLASKKEESNRNNGVAEGAQTLGGNGAHFGCLQSMHPTEIDPIQTREKCGSEKPPISVDDSLFTLPSEPRNDPLDDEEVRL